MNILRYRATAAKCDVAPITIRRWSSDPKYVAMGFPKPIELGDNSVGFIEEEIDTWLAERAAARQVA